MFCGMEYSFHQFRFAVLAVLLVASCACACWQATGNGKIFDLELALEQKWKHQCVVNIFLMLNPKHNVDPLIKKKINSIPGETRTVHFLYCNITCGTSTSFSLQFQWHNNVILYFKIFQLCAQCTGDSVTLSSWDTNTFNYCLSCFSSSLKFEFGVHLPTGALSAHVRVAESGQVSAWGNPNPHLFLPRLEAKWALIKKMLLSL